jgi:hypothetical protein
MFYFNFSNMKYSVCRLYACFLFTSNCLCVCVYSFHRAELLIFKHMISMATRSRTSIIRKLLSVFKERERQREREGGGRYKTFSLRKESFKSFAFPRQLNTQNNTLKVEKCVRKTQKQQNIVW